MAIPVSELQKSNPSNIIELFQLELITAIHGSNTKYYWHNGVSENENLDIVFDSIQYIKMPIDAFGFEFTSKQLPRPKLQISNILGTFTTLMLTLPQGLEGAKVTRLRTLERYIDNTNFDPGHFLLEDGIDNVMLQEDDSVIKLEEIENPHGTPDASALFPKEIYYIDRKTIENRQVVEFELSANFDLDGVRLPKRQVLPEDFPGVGSFFS